MLPKTTLLAPILFLVACGGSEPGGPTPTADANAETSSDAANDAANDASNDAPPATLDVPTGASALLPWLNARKYAGFAAESTTHPSAGPHATTVRTFLSPKLNASLAAGAKEHPAGAAAVKELYGSDGKLTGWAVEVKTDAASANGAGWYWYEVLSLSPGATPVADGNGVKLCTNCHVGGVDYVLTTYPLK